MKGVMNNNQLDKLHWKIVPVIISCPLNYNLICIKHLLTTINIATQLLGY